MRRLWGEVLEFDVLWGEVFECDIMCGEVSLGMQQVSDRRRLNVWS